MKSLTVGMAFGLALALSVGAGRAFAQCHGCPRAAQHGSNPAIAAPEAVKLLELGGDTVDLVQERSKGPRVLFTFRADSVGRKAVMTVQKAWVAFGDSNVKLLGVFCGPKKQAEALKKEMDLDFPILLDQGCAGQLVLGLEKCPGALFVNDAGRPVGLMHEFLEELMQQGMEAAAEPSTAVDPVCKMTVDKATAAAKYVYQTRTYYFCSTACRDAFAGNPEKYLARQ